MDSWHQLVGVWIYMSFSARKVGLIKGVCFWDFFQSDCPLFSGRLMSSTRKHKGRIM